MDSRRFHPDLIFISILGTSGIILSVIVGTIDTGRIERGIPILAFLGILLIGESVVLKQIMGSDLKEYLLCQIQPLKLMGAWTIFCASTAGVITWIWLFIPGFPQLQWILLASALMIGIPFLTSMITWLRKK